VTKVLKAAAVLALVAAAASLAIAAHAALSSRAHHSARWDRALSYARAAGRTKPLIPALTLRSRALAELAALAREGSRADRSHAATLAGLLELVDSGQDRGNADGHIAAAASLFRRAVTLDPGNDDAAYDLELLLARAKAEGRSVGQARPEKKKIGKGRPGTERAGSGY